MAASPLQALAVCDICCGGVVIDAAPTAPASRDAWLAAGDAGWAWPYSLHALPGWCSHGLRRAAVRPRTRDAGASASTPVGLQAALKLRITRIQIQVMRSSAPALLPIFRSRLQADILALLLNPDDEYSLTELAQRFHAPLSTVHGEVKRDHRRNCAVESCMLPAFADSLATVSSSCAKEQAQAVGI